jgi:hypothetical protein
MQEGIHVLENPRLMKKGRRKREIKTEKGKRKDEGNISVQNIHKKDKNTGKKVSRVNTYWCFA